MANEWLNRVFPYTIPKGICKVQKDGVAEVGKWFDLGNIKEFKLNVATETKDHYSTASGLNILDKSIVVKIDFAGSFILDVLDKRILQMFLYSDDPTAADQSSGSVTDQVVILPGDQQEYWLGKRDISEVVVTNSAGDTTYDEDVDYKVDYANGFIARLDGGAITVDQSVKVDYEWAAKSMFQLDAGALNNLKRHFWFIGDPPEGVQRDAQFFGSLSPNGDWSQIGDDFQELGFNFKVEKHVRYPKFVKVLDKGLATLT